MSFPFSASSMERATICPSSTALPRVYRTTNDSERGQGVHFYLRQRGQGISAEDALALVPEKWQATCKGINLESEFKTLGIREPRFEVAFAVQAETGKVRELGQGLERKYQLEPGEIPGTVDLLGESFRGYPLIADFKTGYEDVTDVEQNLQIQFYAYAAARSRNADRAEAYIGYVDAVGNIGTSLSAILALPPAANDWDLAALAERRAAMFERLRPSNETAIASGVRAACSSNSS